MSDQDLYDSDILLWSEQQADALRRLGRVRGGLPNELDIENVAEEIESVGRSELAAVKSQIRLIFIHIIKLAVDAQADAARHWRSEILAFHAELIGRYSASMRQRIDIDAIWRSACDQVSVVYAEAADVTLLPAQSPFTLDDFLGARLDGAGLAERLRQAMAEGR